MKHFLIIAPLALAIAACSDPAPTPPAGNDTVKTEQTETDTADTTETLIPALQNVPAGSYELESTHAFLSFTVPHGNGLSNYRINLTDFSLDLDADPANPEAASLTVTINPMGVEANYPNDYKAGHPDSAYENWNEDIARNPQILNADAHPEITFTSTNIERTGDMSGKVTGDLTLLGQTRPVTLDVTFRGGAPSRFMPGRYLLGFDAETVFNRSDFGSSAMQPFVGDEIKVHFTGELISEEQG